MTTNRHSDAREMAEAVAKWCGWVYDPSMPADMRWKAPRGDLVDAAPAYWRSLDAMREVEDEIERRGLFDRYVDELMKVQGWITEWAHVWEHPKAWRGLVLATALQRLQAAARVIEEVERAG